MPTLGVARKFGADLTSYVLELSEKKVDAYEMGFAYGIPGDIPDNALRASEAHGVALSCHLPFWINLANSHTEKNVDYLLAGMKIAEQLRSTAVFHLGFYLGKDFSQIRDHVVEVLKGTLSVSSMKAGRLGIETTGKQKAIGTPAEIAEIVRLIDDDRVIPVIDWSHLFARSSGMYPFTSEDFSDVLDAMEREIGYAPYYFHGGGIEHRRGNEVRHLSAKTFTPPLPNLFAAIQATGPRNFTLIVESPDSVNDVAWLRQVWESPSDYAEEISRVREEQPLSLEAFANRLA